MTKKISKKIIVAKRAGFCFGVRRAVEMAKEAAKKEKGRVFCLGEIIHNPQAVVELEKLGLRTIENMRSVRKGDALVIRSHGVAPEIIQKAEKRGVKIIDATCPFVKNAQKVAADFQKEGRQVIIFGDPFHSEVIGIKGHAKKAIIVQNEKEVAKIGFFPKIGLLAQTTQKPDIFKKIITEVSDCTNDIRVANTICSDSFKKKEEVKEIAQKVDLMIVVGGKNSNNTKKLAEVSQAVGVKTYHIETMAELKDNWFQGAEKIGIAAGASTPDESIKKVLEKIAEQG